jgi:hypothetical protein
MNSEKLREWANDIELVPDNRLRDPSSSKHQRKIIEIQKLVKQAQENPTLEVYQLLRKVNFIQCRGATYHVSRCRYLQHCINELDNVVQKDEGTEE